MRRAAVAVVAVALLGAAACSDAPPPAPQPSVREVRWTEVALPDHGEPLLVRAAGEVALVAARTGGRAALYRLTSSDRVDPVPLEPRSVYAPVARWVDLMTDGSEVLAIGRAAGGAHGIPRWTVWGGTAEGVGEQPQPFETFGGPRSGGLAAVALGADPVVVGTWDDGGPGLDTTIWHRASATAWERLPVQPVLASTDTVLPQPASVAAGRTRLVVAGSTTDLAGAEIVTRASAWVAADPTGPWGRVDLPATATSARATGVACTADDVCWMAGLDGSQPALWRLPTSGSASRVALPPGTAVVPDHAPVVAVDGSHTWVALAAPTGTTLLGDDGDRWLTAAGPPGAPLAVATWEDRLAVVTTTGSHASLSTATQP